MVAYIPETIILYPALFYDAWVGNFANDPRISACLGLFV